MTATDSESDGANGNHVSVAIIGGGMSGICIGIKLKEAGIEDFTIYEKAEDPGGTWRDNTYPGLACDVPSHMYSFSFEPNPDWSRVFSPGWEIQDYFVRCSDKYGITPHMRFGAEITDARFDEATSKWHLTDRSGETFTANVLITGVGALHNPAFPDIPGIEDFQGTMFHSAQWHHDHDLSGQRVAIIGSAASAVQIVPNIADKVADLSVFQRTPNWLIPRGDKAYSGVRKKLFRWFPVLRTLYRYLLYWSMELRFPRFLQTSGRNHKFRKICIKHLEAQIPDARLREALTPDFNPGCKRLLLSDDFYPALMRYNVHLVTDGIKRVEAGGVVTANGRTHEVDTIILATGFKATELLAPMEISGAGGTTLTQAWANGAEAHRTVTLPGFPNFFMMTGPNSALGHNSIIFMAEAQARYIIQCIGALEDGKAKQIAPKREAFEAFNARIQEDLKDTIWASGCNSWYQDENGKLVVMWPYGTVRYWRELRNVKWDEYDLVS